jgi:flagellar protein FliO/FliZ
VNVSSVCVNTSSLGLLFTSPVLLAADNSLTAVSPMAAAGKVALFLVLILALILGLAWLSRKTRLAQWSGAWGKAGGPDIPMRTLGTLNMGIKEKIAVIQVGNKRLVVGITPQQISTLAELTDADLITGDRVCDPQNKGLEPIAEADGSAVKPVKPVGTPEKNKNQPAASFADLLKKTLIRADGA